MTNPFEELASELAMINKKIDLLTEQLLNQAPPAPTDDKLLTTDEAAEMLSVNRVTLWHWRNKGILKPIRAGNMLRYRLSDIQGIGQPKDAE